MHTTYHFSSAQEITIDIIEAIKVAYKSKAITVTIEEEMDTTEYLMSSKKNRESIERSLAQHAAGEVIIIKHDEL